MPFRLNHVNKKTGLPMYMSLFHSGIKNKEKKQSRNKQVCVGKLDPVSGDFIPSKRLNPEQAAIRDPTVTASAEIIGPSFVLDDIAECLGLEKLLRSCFPQEYQQIQAMAYYLATQGGSLCYCGTWCKNHAPSAECLTSQRISEILSAISIGKRQTFFSKG